MQSAGNIIVISVWGYDGVSLADYIAHTTANIGDAYVSVLWKLSFAIRGRRGQNMINDEMLLYNNTPLHKSLGAIATISGCGLEEINYSPYSRELPPLIVPKFEETFVWISILKL
jgi:hypothetical protein